MSVWRDLRSYLLLDDSRELEPFGDTIACKLEAPRDPREEKSESVARSFETAVEEGDQEGALARFDELAELAGESAAIGIARHLITPTAATKLMSLKTRIAERADTRGEELIAELLLTPLLAEPTAPLDAWMLSAEIMERQGRTRDALSVYERVIARQLDYPRARERAIRLRDELIGPKRDDGATLMAEGALTRGRYRLVRELGRGGAGTVFLADDQELGRRVALKVYHRRGRADRSRLLQEARAAASFEHPSIIRIFDVDEALGAIAMENLEQGSIRGALTRGRIDAAKALAWLESAVEGLRFIHESGLVHRDLKPSNLLIRRGARAVLSDFGSACRVGERSATSEGTLAYMPPEQRAAAAAHPAMDIYALGATIRELGSQMAGPAPESLEEIGLACMRGDPAARPSLEALRVVIRAAKLELGSS